jgi:hypothetical protein
MDFTVIEKECIQSESWYDRYRIVISGDFSYFDGRTRGEIIDTCTLCNYGGHVEQWHYDSENNATTFIISVFLTKRGL